VTYGMLILLLLGLSRCVAGMSTQVIVLHDANDHRFYTGHLVSFSLLFPSREMQDMLAKLRAMRPREHVDDINQAIQEH